MSDSPVKLKIRGADPALRGQQVLSPSEHDRLASMHQGARPAFVAARAMLREELGLYMGLTASAVPLRQEGAGRVEIDGFSPSEPPFFSVSHTGAAEEGIAAVLVCETTPVGIDIQQIDHAIDWRRVAERRLPEAEWALLSAMPPQEGRMLFFTLWSIKEAFVKMEDGKLMPYLRSIEISFKDGAFELSAPTPRGLEKAGIFFTFLPEYDLAIACVSRDPIALELDCHIERFAARPNSLTNRPDG